MKEIILAKFGEIVLKGLNKNTFEAQLLRNVKRRLKPLGKFDFWKAQSTLYIKPIDEELIARLKEHDFDLDIYYPCLTKEWVDRLHAEGIVINCWTCDDGEIARSLVNMGVDFITTNILEGE